CVEPARRHGDYAVAGVGAVVTRAGAHIETARLALTGVGDGPVRAREAETLLAGQPLTPALVAEAVAAVRRAIDPGGDIHATAEYRRHVAGVLVGRAITAAGARARGGADRRRGAAPPRLPHGPP